MGVVTLPPSYPPPGPVPPKPVDPAQYERGVARVQGSLFSIACWVLGLINVVLWIVLIFVMPVLAVVPFLVAVVFCGLGLGAGRHAREL